MKIGFLGLRGVPAKYGGSETAVEEIGSRLSGRGHEVFVFCRKHKSESDAPIYRGINRVILPSINTPSLDTLSHSLLALLSPTARRCDVIHFIGMGTALLLPIAKWSNVATVTTVDGFDWKRDKWGLLAKATLKKGLAAAFKHSDEILVDARSALSEFEQLFGRPANYVPYGVNLEYTDNTERLNDLGLEPKSYFLFVGRMIPDKGVHTLIDAFTRLHTSHRLVLVGDDDSFGPYMHQIRTMADTDSRILLIPPQYGEHYRQLCSHSLAYVQPSLVEGTSPQLLSALAFGRPVIASGIPTIVETVADTASLFPPGDAAALTEKMASLVSNLQEHEQLAKRASARVAAQYSWDNVTDLIEDASTRAVRKTFKSSC